MSVFYVSAHSKIPKKTKSAFREINSIPDNTYIIMNTQCGKYSWLDDTGFLEKYLTTPEGVKYIRDFVLNTNHIFIDEKRIYRPGEVGPINQNLDFRQIKNTFFLGVNTAPINIKKIKNNMKEKVFQLDRNFFENFYKNFYIIFEPLLYNLNNNDNWSVYEKDPTKFKDKNDLIFGLMEIMSLYGGSVENMSYYHFEKLSTDENYFKKFIDKKIKVNTYSEKIKISNFVKNKGPAIYIIDTCRAYRKVTYVDGIFHVNASKAKGFGELRVNSRVVQKTLDEMRPEMRKNYEERLQNAMKTIRKLRVVENTRTELI